VAQAPTNLSHAGKLYAGGKEGGRAIRKNIPKLVFDAKKRGKEAAEFGGVSDTQPSVQNFPGGERIRTEEENRDGG